MVEVKLQKRPSGHGKNKYFSYVVTLPKSIVEAVPKLSETKTLKVSLDKGKIILSP